MINQKIKILIKSNIKNILFENKKNDIKSQLRINITTENIPSLNKVLIDLLTPKYKNFIKDIIVISPKPTTFLIKLRNDMEFYLIYSNTTYIAKISGKKYYLSKVGNLERACESISNLLSLSIPNTTELNDIPLQTQSAEEKLKNNELASDIAMNSSQPNPNPNQNNDFSLTPEEEEAVNNL